LRLVGGFARCRSDDRIHRRRYFVGELWSAPPAAGQSVTGFITFDDAAPDTGSGFGLYAILSAEATVGSLGSVAFPNSAGGFIQIANSPSGKTPATA